MFTFQYTSNAAAYCAQIFPNDMSDILSVFAGSTNPANDLFPSNSKLTESFGSLTDGCYEDIASDSIILGNKEDTTIQIASGQRVIFQLNYLPKQISETEIKEKLEKFGQLSHFDLLLSTSMEARKSGDKKIGNFRSAEFSFKMDESEQVFLKVKRIRIRGLQVKITQKPILRVVEDEVAPIVQDLTLINEDYSVQYFQDTSYSVRPTCKKYFSGRLTSSSVSIQESQANYYWRQASPQV